MNACTHAEIRAIASFHFAQMYKIHSVCVFRMGENILSSSPLSIFSCFYDCGLLINISVLSFICTIKLSQSGFKISLYAVFRQFQGTGVVIQQQTRHTLNKHDSNKRNHLDTSYA